MEQSLEIRWFYKHHKIVQPIFDWFHAIGGDKDNPITKRTDYYLNEFDKGKLGIKLRDGQLEIKQRIAAISNHDNPWHNKGIIEVYDKCEFNIAKDDKFSDQIIKGENHEDWIALTKERKIIKVTADENKILPGTVMIDDGCSVEITKLFIKDHHWWTFCVEAYAKKHDIKTNLKATLDFISSTFKSTDIFKLKLSTGYPTWLLLQIRK